MFFVCDKKAPAAKLAGAARTAHRPGVGPRSRAASSSSAGSSISRCTSCNEETGADRVSATTRSRCRRAGSRRCETQDPLDHQGVPVRHRLQRRRAVARARSATIGPTSCTRPSRSRDIRPKRSRRVSAACSNAFKFGAPPHGGSAPGIDRIVMLLADEPNIREVVAFPMNQQAQDLLMQAPSDGAARTAEGTAYPPGAAAGKERARGRVN